MAEDRTPGPQNDQDAPSGLQGGNASTEPHGGSTPDGRQYPGLYEKGIPIALGLIVVAIALVIIVIVAVALGLFPGM